MNFNQTQLNKSLTACMWEAALRKGYMQEALDTKFIQGIKNGNLHPEIYGSFMVQDYAYQEEAALLFEKAEQKVKELGDNDLAGYIAPFREKYRKRSDKYFKQWGLKKDGINLSPECENYLRFWREALERLGPDYIFVMHYCCRMLWPWLADQIKGHIPIETNAYGFWIIQYETTKPETKMTEHIDSFYRAGRICPKKAWNLFQMCMVGEINFLKEPFEEPMLEMVEWMN